MPYGSRKTMYKRTYKKKYSPKRKIVSRAVKQANKKIFAKNVLKVVKGHTETKYGAPYLENGLSLTAQDGATNVMTLYDLKTGIFENVQQGSGQGDRVGNQISPVSISFKGSLVNTSISTRPFLVKMFVFKDKLNQVSNSAGDLSDIFQLGNQEQGPLNLPSDMIHRWNKDRYIVYTSRVFKLGSSTPTSNPNNDFSVQRFFNINLTKHFKKIMYDDDNGCVKPSNLWVGFLIAYADNTAITFGPYTGPSCQISFTGEISFKDD